MPRVHITRGFYNEEQKAFVEKLLNNFSVQELRLLPQMFEQWEEDNDESLHEYYDITEVYNMGLTFTAFSCYNHLMSIYMTDEELQQLNEARQKEVDFLQEEHPTDDSVEGIDPIDLPY